MTPMAQELLNRLKLIGIFCHVVESGSMRDAARKLGLSPPAISQYINQLEKDLDVTLLYRSTRRISLSEAGEKYYRQGKKMLEAAELAQEVIHQSKQTISGELRIALPVGLAAQPIAQALFPLFAEHPDLRLSIIARDNQIDFIQERIDVLIDCGEPEDSNYIYHQLGKSSKVICASPEYLQLKGSPIRPQQLPEHTWLGMGQTESKGILTSAVLNHSKLGSYQLQPEYRFKFNDLNSLISHVQQGYGIALLPLLEVRERLKQGELVMLLPDWQMEQYDIFALTLDKKYPSKVKVVLAALREFFAAADS